MRTLVINIPARTPLDNGSELAANEISGAHKYYNALIEMERGLIERKAELRRQFLPGLADVEQAIKAATSELDALRSQIKARNAVTRKRTATAEDRAASKAISDKRRELWAQRKAIMTTAEANKEYMTACESLYQDRLTIEHRLYAEAACGWGTRLKIKEQTERACDSCTVDDLPKFRRWTGDGIISCQLQQKIKAGQPTYCTLADIEAGTDTRLKLERGEKKHRHQWATVSVRIGSVEGTNKPIWLRLPVALNKDFDERWPADAKIVWATVVRRQGAYQRHKDGWKPHYWWSVQLTIRTDEEKQPAISGRCGVDLGWRLMDDGRLRVAYWIGDDGREGDLRIDPRPWLEIDDLHAISGCKFADVQAQFIAWFSANADGIPESMREEVATLSQWRSHGRLCRFVERWERMKNDGGIYAIASDWREREAALQLQMIQRAHKIFAYRREVYRVFAAELADRYRCIAVEDCDWRTLNALPATETNESVNELARRMMRIASVGMLRQCIAQSGAVVNFSESENTTRTCNGCGLVNTFAAEDRVELVLTCRGCGESWDQDRNAAINLLASARMVDENPAPARESQPPANGEVAANGHAKGGRFQRRKTEALAKRSKRADTAMG